MSVWWDGDKQKYRYSLPYKVFYVWGWPFFRFVMHNCMTPEQAHWFAIHIAIPWVYRIDRIWGYSVTLLFIVPLVLLCRLLTCLPWFTWKKEEGN